jgi:outer membrane lipoprotein-sorting protein
MRVVARALALLSTLAGCSRTPPPSQFPTAAAALERMRATYSCSRGIQGDAKIDYFGEQGRARGSILYMASLPDRIRFDVFSPFGVTLSTLTSDGQNFALFDLKQKQFLQGPANTCNVSRFTQVPVPPHALVQLLRGEAPVLVHAPEAATIAWESGRYVVRVPSKHDASERIELEPTPADWTLPWASQRVRVLSVSVEQKGFELYEALLEDHVTARTAKPRVDPDGLTADVPPSGPVCTAEVPRRLRLTVPGSDQDVIFINREVAHNPPLAGEPFRQNIPRGVSVRSSDCAR